MRVHESRKKIIVIVFFGIVSIAAVTTGLLIQNNRNVSSSQASSICNCTDENVCYPSGCSRKPKTEDNRFDEARYDSVCKQFDPGYRMSDERIEFYCSQQQPDCCFDIYRYKDDRLCCFQERWTCHPSLCEGAGGNGDCGKYWSLPRDWNAYGCVKKGADGSKIPAWGLPPGLPGTAPTSTPPPTATTQPTATPTTVPQATATPRPANTSTPSPSPTVLISPNATQGPTVTTVAQSTSAPQAPSPTAQTQAQQPTPTTVQSQNTDTVLPPFELPKFVPPKIAIKDIAKPENIEKVNEVTDPPLTAIKDTFITVQRYDQRLEIFVERYVNFFYSALKNTIR